MQTFSFPQGRLLDLICLGRAGVDFYAEEEGVPLEAVTRFRKSVGGSPANMATAFARLGGRAGIISMVSGDGFGRYVRQFLTDNAVDVQGLKTARDASLNSAAFTEMRPTDCKVIIYRQGAADLQLAPADVDASYIANARALLVTGTALSASPSRQACLLAMNAARAAAAVVVLDLDYRPYGWRDVSEASLYLSQAAALADMVIGNREEFDVLQPPSQDREAGRDAHAQALLCGVTQAVVVKDGAKGCVVHLAGGECLRQGIYTVQARKPFGSGDAFAATMLWALMQGKAWPEATRLGAAAAAINVSRNACAEAMATPAELQDFMTHHPSPPTHTITSALAASQ